MMLRLLGAMLCLTLCLAAPAPPKGCAITSLIHETLSDVRTLKSKGSSKITPPNNMMEVEGTASTYLEGFIKALKSSKENSKERLKLVQKLQKIHVNVKSWLKWMKWEPVEEEDFFSNLEYLLRFVNHNAPSKDRK